MVERSFTYQSSSLTHRWKSRSNLIQQQIVKHANATTKTKMLTTRTGILAFSSCRSSNSDSPLRILTKFGDGHALIKRDKSFWCFVIALMDLKFILRYNADLISCRFVIEFKNVTLKVIFENNNLRFVWMIHLDLFTNLNSVGALCWHVFISLTTRIAATAQYVEILHTFALLQFLVTTSTYVRTRE
jgi:hypothetical protein